MDKIFKNNIRKTAPKKVTLSAKIKSTQNANLITGKMVKNDQNVMDKNIRKNESEQQKLKNQINTNEREKINEQLNTGEEDPTNYVPEDDDNIFDK